LDGVASVLELVLGVGLALLGLALGLGLLVVGDLAEALLGLAAQLVLRVLELLVSTHRQPPGVSAQVLCATASLGRRRGRLPACWSGRPAEPGPGAPRRPAPAHPARSSHLLRRERDPAP